MKLTFQPFGVDLTSLARAILDGGTREEVIELIKQLDVQEADWSLTAALADYFQTEMREYANAQEEASREAAREVEKQQLGLIEGPTGMQHLGTLDDGTVVLYKPTEGPTVVQDPLAVDAPDTPEWTL